MPSTSSSKHTKKFKVNVFIKYAEIDFLSTPFVMQTQTAFRNEKLPIFCVFSGHALFRKNSGVTPPGKGLSQIMH